MAQSDPPASYTDPQPRRSTRPPKPSKRDPNFIYENFQRHLQNFDDSQGQDQKETKRKVKHASSKQSTKVPDPGRQYAELPSKLLDLHLYDLGQDDLSPPDYKPAKIVQSKSTHHQPPQPSASPERDLQLEVRLVKLQKEKLALELEVFRLHHAPNSSPDGDPGEKTSSSASAGANRKKRAVDWPDKFAQVPAIVSNMIRLIYYSL